VSLWRIAAAAAWRVPLGRIRFLYARTVVARTPARRASVIVMAMPKTAVRLIFVLPADIAESAATTVQQARSAGMASVRVQRVKRRAAASASIC
jgi:hypothetical protein